MKLADNMDRHKILDELENAWSDNWLWSYLPFSAKKPHIRPCPEDSDLI